MTALVRALRRVREVVSGGSRRRTQAAFLALGVMLALGAMRADIPMAAIKALSASREAPIFRSTPLAALRLALPFRATDATAAGWHSLSDQSWAYASTGWQVLADTDLPIRNTSFIDGPMQIGGRTFNDGISVYPLSEIVFPIDRRALRFTAAIGVTDDSKRGAGSVRFTVYGDEFILYSSDVVRAGEAARAIDVSVEGLDQLRLVVDDGGDGSLGDYALWAEPRLLRADAEPSPTALDAIARAREEQRQQERGRRADERRMLTARAELDRAALALVEVNGPGARGAFHSDTGLLVIGNDRVGATLGYGGSLNGRIDLLRWGEDVPVLVDASPSLVTNAGRAITLTDLRPQQSNGYSLRRVEDAAGAGLELRARYRVPDGPGVVIVSLTVYDADAAVTIGMTAENFKLQSVEYLGQQGGSIVIGDGVHYLSDRSHLYTGAVLPDGLTRRAALEATKPALMWSDEAERGVLLTFMDYTVSPAWLSIQREGGAEAITLGVELTASPGDFGVDEAAPPALTIELLDGAAGPLSFARYQRVMRARYPEAPWPANVRFQWGSWYAFGPGITAAILHAQLERLAASFGDLGAWQFMVDAGWHLQYGREDAALGTVDFEKFPGGVRDVADRAHSLGMSVLLYLGTGFIHDSAENGGEWLALRGMIEQYPEWMIPFQQEPSSVNRYLLDYANPEVQAYIRALIRDFFLVHGVDGVAIDGLADAEGQLIPRIERDRADGPPHPLLPIDEVYRMVWEEGIRHRPDMFIESGWLSPIAAEPYAHIFRYGDEIDRVDSPYPFGGFLQRLDYAIFSRMALGQRNYVGTATGDPALPETRWWMQAASALGSDAALSFDLRVLDANGVAAFRADLNAMEPFQGDTRFGPGLFPDTFATTRHGVTYLGVVNRDPKPRDVPVALDPLGLSGRSYAALEVQSERTRAVDGDFTVAMPARSFRLFVLRPTDGVLWTDSVLQTDGLESVLAQGPSDIPGFLVAATAPPTAVLLDGRPLSRGATATQNAQYAYDDVAGVLTIRYAHNATGRRIEIRR